MKNKRKEKQSVDIFEVFTKTEEYSSQKRGEIIHLTIEIENILTDIFAHIFYPGKYTPDIKDTKLLVKKDRIQIIIITENYLQR